MNGYVTWCYVPGSFTAMKQFIYNVVIDTLLRKGGKTYVLAPGQAFLVYKSGLIAKRPKVTLVLRDAISYADTSVSPPEYFFLSEAPGKSCYVPALECGGTDNPSGRAIVGYGCGRVTYGVSELGLERKKFQRTIMAEVVNDVCTARLCAKTLSTSSPAGRLARHGSVMPVLMAPLTKKLKKLGLEKVSIPMRVPGEGMQDMVELPIPLLLPKYEDTLRTFDYSKEDIRLHKMIARSAIHKFLSENGIKEVYVGLPNEGTSPFIRAADADNLFTEEDYASYSPIHPLRCVASVNWNPSSRYAPINSGATDATFAMIREKRLRFRV